MERLRLGSGSRKASAVLLAAVLAIGGPAASAQTLLANGAAVSTVAIGAPLVVTLSGPAGAGYLWAADLSIGPAVISGLVIPIGFSPAFLILGSGPSFPGVITIPLNTAVSPGLAGVTVYSVAAFANAAAPLGFILTNGLSISFALIPPPARNPVPPDAVFAGNRGVPAVLSVVNTAGITRSVAGPPNTQGPVVAGGFLTGAISPAPNPLSDPLVLGSVADIEIGHWMLSSANPAQTSNGIFNPPRGTVLVPGVPDSQNGTSPRGLLDVVLNNIQSLSPPAQPLGNYVYVADTAAGAVRVFNGYDFQLITTIAGLGTPGGLGISPDLATLFVSDSTSGNVIAFAANPASPNFHSAVALIPVGSGPTAVTVQPDGQDVLVANQGGNSFTVIDASTLLPRATFADPAAIGPTQIHVTRRMLGLGLLNAYTAFVVNTFSDNVTVFESSSPVSPENGPNGAIKATLGGFNRPSGGTWNWNSYFSFLPTLTYPGCFVANARGGTVDEIGLTNFFLGTPPNFGGPPSIRTYAVVRSLSAAALPSVGQAAPTDATLDAHSGLPALALTGRNNNKGLADPITGGGASGALLVSYPAAGIVVAFDAATSAIVGSATVPGCDFLHGYYDQ